MRPGINCPEQLFTSLGPPDVGCALRTIILIHNRERVQEAKSGGVKASGLGRGGVRYAMEELTDLRLLALKV